MAARHKYRLKCQTINKQNKLPCKASGILMKNGNIRCRMHGGFSNGQTTLAGKIKAFRNLKQFKNSNDEEIRTHIRGFQRHPDVTHERQAFDANMRNERLSELK